MGEEIGLIRRSEEVLKACHGLRERLASLCDRLMGPQPEVTRADAPSGMRYGGVSGNIESAAEVLTSVHVALDKMERVIGPAEKLSARADAYGPTVGFATRVG